MYLNVDINLVLVLISCKNYNVKLIRRHQLKCHKLDKMTKLSQ